MFDTSLPSFVPAVEAAMVEVADDPLTVTPAKQLAAANTGESSVKSRVKTVKGSKTRKSVVKLG